MADWSTYLKRYPDLQKAFGDRKDKAKDHFMRHGFKEKRNCGPDVPHYIFRSNDPAEDRLGKWMVAYDETNFEGDKNTGACFISTAAAAHPVGLGWQYYVGPDPNDYKNDPGMRSVDPAALEALEEAAATSTKSAPPTPKREVVDAAQLLERLFAAIIKSKPVPARAEVGQEDLWRRMTLEAREALDTVEALLKQDTGNELPVSARLTDRNGLTCLHVAAMYGNADAAKLCVMNGADLTARMPVPADVSEPEDEGKGNVPPGYVRGQFGSDTAAAAATGGEDANVDVVVMSPRELLEVAGYIACHFAATFGAGDVIKVLFQWEKYQARTLPYQLEEPAKEMDEAKDGDGKEEHDDGKGGFKGDGWREQWVERIGGKAAADKLRRTKDAADEASLAAAAATRACLSHVEEGEAKQVAEAAAAETAEVEAKAKVEVEAAAAVVDHPEASQFNDAWMTLYSAVTHAGRTTVEVSLGTWSGKPAEEGDPPVGVITGPHSAVSAFLVPPPNCLRHVRAPGGWKAGSTETTRASWAKGSGQAVMGQWTSRVAASCIALTPVMLLGDAGPSVGGGAGEFDVSLEHLMKRLESIAATADRATEAGEDEGAVAGLLGRFHLCLMLSDCGV